MGLEIGGLFLELEAKRGDAQLAPVIIALKLAGLDLDRDARNPEVQGIELVRLIEEPLVVFHVRAGEPIGEVFPKGMLPLAFQQDKILQLAGIRVGHTKKVLVVKQTDFCTTIAEEAAQRAFGDRAHIETQVSREIPIAIVKLAKPLGVDISRRAGKADDALRP